MNGIRLLLWTASIVLVYGSIRGDNTVTKYFALSDSLSLLSQTVADIQGNVDHLQLEIHKLENSPHYARKVLRDKFHTTEENESIIFFAD